MSAGAAAVLVGAAWAAAVLTVAWRRRPLRPVRLPGSGPNPRQHRSAPQLTRLPRRRPRRLPRQRLQLIGLLLLAVTVGAVLGPAVPLLIGGSVLVLRRVQARRAEAARQARVAAAIPEAVDLFALAIGAGLTPHLAVPAVARHIPEEVGRALEWVVAEVDLGRRLADVLDELPGRLGEPVRPLAAALAAAERYGVPLLDSLAHVAGEARLERRRQAEAAARRVPVLLLFPLVFCTLPAFALLTVAPLIASAVRALRL